MHSDGLQGGQHCSGRPSHRRQLVPVWEYSLVTSSVLEANGNPMCVRTALQIINSELDVYFAEQEGDLDPDTRFCIYVV